MELLCIEFVAGPLTMVTTVRINKVYDTEPLEWLDNNVSKIKVRDNPYIGEGWRLTWVTNRSRVLDFTEVEIDDKNLAIEFIMRFT
jgi:hypothetical protein